MTSRKTPSRRSSPAAAPAKPAAPPARSEAPPSQPPPQPAARWQRVQRYVWDKGGSKGGRR